MYCHQCGKEVSDEAKFCPYCGAQLSQSDFQENTQQNMNYQPNGTYQPLQQGQPRYNEEDAPSVGFAILSFFIPIAGFILFLVWNKELPLKAKSCLKGFVIGIVTYVVVMCCFISAIASQSYNEYHHYSDDWDVFSSSVVETISYDTID